MVKSAFDDGPTSQDEPASPAASTDPREHWRSLISALMEVDSACERETAAIRESSLDDQSKASLLEKVRSETQRKRQLHFRELAPRQGPSRPRPSAGSDDPTARRLSAQEADVLHLLMEERRNAVISAQLGLDETAVKDHIKAILRKVQPARLRPKLVPAVDNGEPPGPPQDEPQGRET